MKARIKEETEKRELVAVLGKEMYLDRGRGIFLRRAGGDTVYIDTDGSCITCERSLEVQAKDPERIPVYKGDTVALEF